MRLLNTAREEISETDIDLTKGKLYTKRIIKPDAVPVDDIAKFAYTDDDYEEVQIYESTPDLVLIQERINTLKQSLSASDYVVLKIAEGVATQEEYAEILTSRQIWRKEINELEVALQEMS